jgi:hypothetical protein
VEQHDVQYGASRLHRWKYDPVQRHGPLGR